MGITFFVEPVTVMCPILEPCPSYRFLDHPNRPVGRLPRLLGTISRTVDDLDSVDLLPGLGQCSCDRLHDRVVCPIKRVHERQPRKWWNPQSHGLVTRHGEVVCIAEILERERDDVVEVVEIDPFSGEGGMQVR